MPGLSVGLKIVFDEVPADTTKKCWACKIPFKEGESMWVMMSQIGAAEAMQVRAFDAYFCASCNDSE